MNRKMILGDPPPIQITNRDFGRIDVLLGSLASQVNPQTLEFLQGELDRAQLVDEDGASAPFVRIGSHVLFRDERGQTYRLTLELPSKVSQGPGKISIITPVGAALLGMSAGQSISYETPDRRIKTVKVLEVSDSRSSTAQAPAS
jgi:regulator of nucleoside diphosphate kinase